MWAKDGALLQGGCEDPSVPPAVQIGHFGWPCLAGGVVYLKSEVAMSSGMPVQCVIVYLNGLPGTFGRPYWLTTAFTTFHDLIRSVLPGSRHLGWEDDIDTAEAVDLTSLAAAIYCQAIQLAFDGPEHRRAVLLSLTKLLLIIPAWGLHEDQPPHFSSIVGSTLDRGGMLLRQIKVQPAASSRPLYIFFVSVAFS